MVYVILHGRFITIFTGKLFQYSPDPAPVLHGLFAISCQFLRDMALCDLPQRDFPLPVVHLLMGRDRACGAHDPDIKVRHGEVGAVKGSNCLVAFCLCLKPKNITGKILFKRGRGQVPGVAAEEFIRSLSGDNAPVPVRPAHRAMKYWVTAMLVFTGSFFGIAATTAGRASAISSGVISTSVQVRLSSSAACRACARSWDPSRPTATHSRCASAATRLESTPPENAVTPSSLLSGLPLQSLRQGCRVQDRDRSKPHLPVADKRTFRARAGIMPKWSRAWQVSNESANSPPKVRIFSGFACTDLLNISHGEPVTVKLDPACRLKQGYALAG